MTHRTRRTSAGTEAAGCLTISGLGCFALLIAILWYGTIFVAVVTAIFWGIEAFGYDVPNFDPSFPFYF